MLLENNQKQGLVESTRPLHLFLSLPDPIMVAPSYQFEKFVVPADFGLRVSSPTGNYAAPAGTGIG